MSLRTQLLIWAGFLLATILFLFVFRSILLPFVIGIAMAYLLNPMVSWLQKVGIRRVWAIAIMLFVLIAIIISFFLALVPLVGDQVIDLVARLPRYVGDLQRLVEELAPQLAAYLGQERAAQIEASLTQMIGTGVEFFAGLTATIFQGGLGVLNTIAVLFIAPVVAFYLLLDWEGMVKRVDDLLPREHRYEIRGILREIDHSMAGVIRGQGSVILVLMIYYSTSLSLVGLNFGLAIGIIGGLLSFVPFVGFLTGFVLSMAVALVQFWPDRWVFIAIVFAIYVIGQFLEGNILYPKLVGQSININAVWLMFALFAFALLFGFVGLLLAVPLAAIAGVLTRYVLKKYQESQLYSGRPSKPAHAATASERHLDDNNEPLPEAPAPVSPPAPRKRAPRKAAADE
jgi:predicted PurR-regulated permease PerM